MSYSETERRDLLDAITDIADRAGKLVMEVYATDFDVRRKEDASPVTEADERAEALILPALRDLLPGVAAIGEEAAAQGRDETVKGTSFWLVDPLDGTKEFLRRNGEFTVNIALIENGAPVLGIVAAPAVDRAFRACGPGTAEKREDDKAWTAISARDIPDTGAIVVSSRSHGDKDKLEALLAGMKVGGHVTAGSSLKFCLVAAGDVDFYPRYGPTCEWDTAAGHAVLIGAGGSVRTLDGADLDYGKSGGWLNPEFIARGLE
ncbi:MAG: 3'(2'),5'-bisphosphate nucleotidase CysQ [Alphaproteobacteria bacterium]